MNALLLVTLVLHPVVEEDATLRVGASGVGDAAVQWSLDGAPLATTHDREVFTVEVAAGAHVLEASSAAETDWLAMARPAPDGPGARYVEAWTAHAPAPPAPEPPPPAEAAAPTTRPWLPLALGAALALLVLVSPKQP